MQLGSCRHIIIVSSIPWCYVVFIFFHLVFSYLFCWLTSFYFFIFSGVSLEAILEEAEFYNLESLVMLVKQRMTDGNNTEEEKDVVSSRCLFLFFVVCTAVAVVAVVMVVVVILMLPSLMVVVVVLV